MSRWDFFIKVVERRWWTPGGQWYIGEILHDAATCVLIGKVGDEATADALLADHDKLMQWVNGVEAAKKVTNPNGKKHSAPDEDKAVTELARMDKQKRGPSREPTRLGDSLFSGKAKTKAKPKDDEQPSGVGDLAARAIEQGVKGDSE